MKQPSSIEYRHATTIDRCRSINIYSKLVRVRVTSVQIIFIIMLSLLLTFLLIDSVKSIRILCLILTVPSNIGTRAQSINLTWAQRCDRFFFVTEMPFYHMTFEELAIAKQLPIAPIYQSILPGYYHLTNKVTLAFQFAFKHYGNEFDWIVKVDDDTYLLVDHLREFLTDKSPLEPVTFGFNFKVKRMICLNVFDVSFAEDFS